MKKINFKYSVFCFFIFSSFTAQATEQSNPIDDECFSSDGMKESRDYVSSSFQWENDIGNSDRWYTNGMKYSRTLDPLSKCKEGYPNVDNFFRSKMGFNDEALPTNAISLTSWVAGMNMYTPKDITNPNPQPNDRPWSGWAYLGRNWQINEIPSNLPDGEELIDINGFTHKPYTNGNQKFEILLGVLGGKAKQDRVQRAWHTLVNAQYPAGWENQDSGKFGYSIAYTRSWNKSAIQQYENSNGMSWGKLVNWRVGAIAGNVVRQVSTGIGGSIDFNSYMSDKDTYIPVASLQSLPQITPTFQVENLPATPRLTPEMVKKIQHEEPTKLKEARINWYNHSGFTIFGDLEAKYLFSSYFLQGTNVKLKQSVLDAKVGFTYKFKHSDCTLRYSYLVRSPEFSIPGGGNSKTQKFSQFSLEWNWGFVKTPFTNIADLNYPANTN
ncbi:MAG: lipid A-modifier LpxR family protein [Sediminibacterium sp.]